jgi:hypothetical protein
VAYTWGVALTLQQPGENKPMGGIGIAHRHCVALVTSLEIGLQIVTTPRTEGAATDASRGDIRQKSSLEMAYVSHSGHSGECRLSDSIHKLRAKITLTPA